MAQVAREPQAPLDIDYHLDYQFRQWASILPWYATHDAELDVVDLEVFQVEWSGITESRLAQLQRWAEQEMLTPPQRRRYDEPVRLVARHRPLVQTLLAEDGRQER